MSVLGNLIGATTQAAFVQSMNIIFAGGKTGLSAAVAGRCAWTGNTYFCMSYLSSHQRLCNYRRRAAVYDPLEAENNGGLTAFTRSC